MYVSKVLDCCAEVQPGLITQGALGSIPEHGFINNVDDFFAISQLSLFNSSSPLIAGNYLADFISNTLVKYESLNFFTNIYNMLSAVNILDF